MHDRTRTVSIRYDGYCYKDRQSCPEIVSGAYAGSGPRREAWLRRRSSAPDKLHLTGTLEMRMWKSGRKSNCSNCRSIQSICRYCDSHRQQIWPKAAPATKTNTRSSSLPTMSARISLSSRRCSTMSLRGSESSASDIGLGRRY